MTERFSNPSDRPAANPPAERASAEDENSIGNLLSIGAQAAWHAGVQEPLRGLAQLANRVPGVNITVPERHDLAQTNTTAGWVAQQIGAGLGMVAPFKAVQALRPLAFGSRLTGTAASIADGATFGALLTPSDDPNSNFLYQRFTGAATGAAAFGTQHYLGGIGARTIGLSEGSALTRNYVFGRLAVNTASGGVAGLAAAETQSLLSRGEFASGSELAESAASFMVTGMALEGIGLSGRAYREARAARAERAAAAEAPRPIERREVPTTELASIVTSRERLQTAFAERLNESRFDEPTAREHSTAMNRLAGRLAERAPEVRPGEVTRTLDAVTDLLRADKLEVELGRERIALAKQLVAEAAQPDLVTQGLLNTCAPWAIQRMALLTNPGAQTQAIVDVLRTGRTTVDVQGQQRTIDLSQQMHNDLGQSIGQSYRTSLQPDLHAGTTLARGTMMANDSGHMLNLRSYASQLAQTINANIKWQALAPASERSVYVRGASDPTLGVDTGERLVHLETRNVVGDSNGQPHMGPGMKMVHIQPVFDALTGSSDQKVALINGTGVVRGPGTLRFNSPEHLQEQLSAGQRPMVTAVDAMHPMFRLPTEHGAYTTHMIVVSPEVNPRTGRQFERNGEPLYSLNDGIGIVRGLHGENGVTARQLFDASVNTVRSAEAVAATGKTRDISDAGWHHLGFGDRLAQLDAHAPTITADLSRGTTGQHIFLREMRNSLKRTGLSAEGWEMFPTEQGSPADSVGQDFWLVNRNSGEMHFLDGTWAKDESVLAAKHNRAGIDVVEFNNDDFSSVGMRTTNPESSARAKALDDQLLSMTRSMAMFDLGLNELPDFRKLGPAAGREELQRFVDSLKARAEAETRAENAADPSRARYNDVPRLATDNFYHRMATDIERSALLHADRVLTSTRNAYFDARVARAAENSVLDHAITSLLASRGRQVVDKPLDHKLPRERFDITNDKDAAAVDEERRIRLIFHTTDNRQVESPPLPDVMRDARLALMRRSSYTLAEAKRRAEENPTQRQAQQDLRDAMMDDKINRRLDAVKRQYNLPFTRVQLDRFLQENGPVIDRGGAQQFSAKNPLFRRLQNYLQSSTEDALLSNGKAKPKPPTDPFNELSSVEPMVREELRKLYVFRDSAPEDIQLGLELVATLPEFPAQHRPMLEDMIAAAANEGRDPVTVQRRDAARRRLEALLSQRE